jgi:hypothetical protein
MMLLVSPTAFALGAASWSFAEYALHRFFGHAPRSTPVERRPGFFDGDFGSEHQAHHTDTRYFTPTSKKLATASVVLPLLGVASSLVAGPRRGVSFTLGFGVAYAGYEILHRRTHTHAPNNPYSRWARRHHLYHHFGSARKNHGVTSPLWDLVFRTYDEPGVIRVPARHAPPWLIDPTTGDVAARYAADYVIAGRIAEAAA